MPLSPRLAVAAARKRWLNLVDTVRESRPAQIGLLGGLLVVALVGLVGVVVFTSMDRDDAPVPVPTRTAEVVKPSPKPSAVDSRADLVVLQEESLKFSADLAALLTGLAGVVDEPLRVATNDVRVAFDDVLSFHVMELATDDDVEAVTEKVNAGRAAVDAQVAVLAGTVPALAGPIMNANVAALQQYRNNVADAALNVATKLKEERGVFGAMQLFASAVSELLAANARAIAEATPPPPVTAPPVVVDPPTPSPSPGPSPTPKPPVEPPLDAVKKADALVTQFGGVTTLTDTCELLNSDTVSAGEAFGPTTVAVAPEWNAVQVSVSGTGYTIQWFVCTP